MRPLLVPLVLMLAGCASVPEGATDGVARAALNQRVYVDGPYVTPLALVEDSRCPADVQCVWAGRTCATVRIDLGSRREVRDLCSDRPLQVADGTLSLVEVLPARAISGAPRHYRFGLRFAGGL